MDTQIRHLQADADQAEAVAIAVYRAIRPLRALMIWGRVIDAACKEADAYRRLESQLELLAGSGRARR